MEKIIENYASKGQDYDVMKALRLLTLAYIKECGISLGYRTLVYVAAERWLERLAWLDLPLSEMARKEPLVNLMPYITEEYAPDIYDQYDITGIDNEEMVECCMEVINNKEFDKETLEVLCWGIFDCVNNEDKECAIEIETFAQDGTLLKGIVEKQDCAETLVRMVSPYNVGGIKYELERDATIILKKIYEDYNRIAGSKELAEVLYEKYKKELCLCNHTSKYKIHFLFSEVFKPLLQDSVLLPSVISDMMEKEFGMEFYDVYKNKFPSWYNERTNNGECKEVAKNSAETSSKTANP